MSEVFTSLFTTVVVVLVSVPATWVNAHKTVATECQRLGAFYVGDKTFECKEKK